MFDVIMVAAMLQGHPQIELLDRCYMVTEEHVQRVSCTGREEDRPHYEFHRQPD